MASIVYDLPFGKGEKFANTGGVINQISADGRSA